MKCVLASLCVAVSLLTAVFGAEANTNVPPDAAAFQGWRILRAHLRFSTFTRIACGA